VKRLKEPPELLAYFSLLDANTGQNQLSDHRNLVYMDLQPHESFDKRYLVFGPIEIFARPNDLAFSDPKCRTRRRSPDFAD
jgi:hypothetical protein